MRPTEEKRQQTIKTYLNLMIELKKKREIKGITSIVYRHGLHLTTSAVLQDLGIIDRYANEYTWIYSGEINQKLAEKVYREVVKRMSKRSIKAQKKSIAKPKMPINYVPPKEYKLRYDFAKLNGFGEHSPVSKMIAKLGNGNYQLGHRLFEKKLKEYQLNNNHQRQNKSQN